MTKHLFGAVLATSIGIVLAAWPVAGQSPASGDQRFERLKQWMTLVAQHQPGQVDAAVATVQLWSAASLGDVRDDLYALRRLICAQGTRFPDPRRSTCIRPPVNTPGQISSETTVGHRKRGGSAREWAGSYTSNHVAALVKFTPEIERRGINDILKRGALLHTDIALKTPPMVTWSGVPVSRFLTRTTVRVVDGLQTGMDQSVDHLAMARRLLDIVTPDPTRDPFTYPERDMMVRDWYRATMAVLLNEQEIFLNHEAAALELFPDDDEVIFQSGALHETLAAKQYQGAVTTRRVANVSVLDSEGGELRRAEQLFRQTLKLNPNHVDARLRLGQVLGQRGRSADALVELRRVETETHDPLLSFYTALFIGREEGTLNNLDAAMAAYQRAASLFPRAQSPQIALSELHMRSGNRVEAARALEVVWGWGTSRTEDDDPWPGYTYAAGRSGGTLLGAIAAAFPPSSVTP